MKLPVAPDEYRHRLLKIRREMARRNLELLILNDGANQHDVTAYDGWSFYMPQVVLIPAEDIEPVWIGRAMDAAGARLTAWMQPEDVVGYPEHFVQQSDRRLMDWIGGRVRFGPRSMRRRSRSHPGRSSAPSIPVPCTRAGATRMRRPAWAQRCASERDVSSSEERYA